MKCTLEPTAGCARYELPPPQDDRKGARLVATYGTTRRPRLKKLYALPPLRIPLVPWDVIDIPAPPRTRNAGAIHCPHVATSSNGTHPDTVSTGRMPLELHLALTLLVPENLTY